MATKEEYEANKQGKLNEQQERQRFENLLKATSLAALNGAYFWLIGRAAINIIDIDQPPMNGLPAVKGRSIRFQIDHPMMKKGEEEAQS